MVNKVMLVGAVTEEPEFRQVSQTSSYYTFDVATDRRWKDIKTGQRKSTFDYVTVVAWSKAWVGDAIRRGDIVYVTGRLQRREIKDGASGVVYRVSEVVAERIENVSRYKPQLPSTERENGGRYAFGDEE